jgi:anti-anti-sigma factor
VAVVPFTLTLGRTDSVALITVGGEVDVATVGRLSGALDEAIREHDRHVVVDGGAITFIDSTGISAIVAAMRRLNRTRRRLGVACTAGSVLGRQLAVTGLDRSLDVHPTADAAVMALADAPLLGR